MDQPRVRAREAPVATVGCVRTRVVVGAFLSTAMACSLPAGEPTHYVPEGLLVWRAETMPELGPRTEGGAHYRYAPSLVQLNDHVRFAYTCANVHDGEIKDHLVYRIATRDTAGAWTWGAEGVALGPRDEVLETCNDKPHAGFDCYHVCDPEYLEGDFGYRGVRYRLALFYTGNDLDASAHNGVGVAFANDAHGPWTRVDAPLIAYDDVCDDASQQSWGTGQPSATSIDGKGRLLLFTRDECRGVRHAVRRIVDLSDFDDTRRPKISAPARLPVDGFTAGAPTPGRVDRSFNDASFVYDPLRDRFFVVRSQHPMPTDSPSNITTQVQIATIDGASLWSGEGAWQPLGDVAPADDGGNAWVTGAPRNHNAGIVRTPYGGLVDESSIEIAYTIGARMQFPQSVFTKRVHTVAASLHL